MLKLSPHCDTVWMWGFWGVIRSWGGALINGVGVFIDVFPESPSSFEPCEDPAGRYISVYEPGSGPLPHPKSTAIVIMDLQMPELWEIHFCSSHSLWYFCYKIPKRLRRIPSKILSSKRDFEGMSPTFSHWQHVSISVTHIPRAHCHRWLVANILHRYRNY